MRTFITLFFVLYTCSCDLGGPRSGPAPQGSDAHLVHQPERPARAVRVAGQAGDQGGLPGGPEKGCGGSDVLHEGHSGHGQGQHPRPDCTDSE